MPMNPGGHYKPEGKGFVIALVKAIRANKSELGTTAQKPRRSERPASRLAGRSRTGRRWPERIANTPTEQ